jgi:D-glycero-alpha-D-manno-heptose-7-phosphate kinase
MKSTVTRPSLVTTMTPLRLSFLGGGTDIADFYRHEMGAVLSTTFDKYIYVTVKRQSPLFNEAYRITYSITEHKQSLDEIENGIVRECLKLVPVDAPLYIHTAADLPANSGLASSSCFAVGLLYGLHAMRGEDVSAGQLAEEACHVEIDRLQHPIGKQDQFAAAMGGLNLIQFHPNGQVDINPISLQGENRRELFDSSLMFWTGIQRSATSVLTSQRENIGNTRPLLMAMRDDAVALRDLLLNRFDLKAFGVLLDINWRRKRELSKLISDGNIDTWYNAAIRAGAYGGKLLGAGGGGFLYFLAPRERHAAIREAMQDLTEVSIAYEPRGTRILYTVP